jgi:predicted Zn finger-like uncharacterized protein
MRGHTVASAPNIIGSEANPQAIVPLTPSRIPLYLAPVPLNPRIAVTRRSSSRARRALTGAAPTRPTAAPGTPATPPSASPGAPPNGGGKPTTARRGTARSGRSRTSGGESAESRRPTIGRDGKAAISCPNCAAQFKIAEANLETKVKCSQCHRTFFPLAAAQSRRAGPDHTKPIVFGVIAVVAIFVIGFIINSLSGPSGTPTPKVVEKPKIQLGGKTKEVRAAIQWAKAIGIKDRLNATFHTDMDTIQKKFDIDKKSPYSRSFGDAKKTLENKILSTLFTADETIVFRAYKPSYGRITDEKMVAAKAGTVRLSLAPRDSKIHSETAEVLVSYAFDEADARFKVQGWRVVHMASANLLLEKVDNKNPRKKHNAHEIIGKAEARDITFGGKKYSISEAELVSLPHLESTSQEDRKTIDALIAKLIDINASGMHFNRADLALNKFGKAAVPRVLNKMYETKMKTQEDVLVLNRLCRFLRNLTGERFGFNPKIDMAKGSDIGATESERVSALKQWYAWWGRYYDRDDWKNIDADDEVELTTKQIEAKRKAEAEAAKKARAERRKKARGK